MFWYTVMIQVWYFQGSSVLQRTWGKQKVSEIWIPLKYLSLRVIQFQNIS